MDMTEHYTKVYFHPSLYLQRYERVCSALEKIMFESGKEDPSPKTVLDLGCAEMIFHHFLRHIAYSVKRLIYVDHDEETLQNVAKSMLRPVDYEHITRRETNLIAEAYAGCVTKFDLSILEGGPPVYCITGIEVIEHLDPEILIGLEKTVFGLIRPPVVILTTPNAEYNSIFGLGPGEFRHDDHRFEWNRDQFEEWCQKICRQYPEYTFTLEGIGEAKWRHDPSLGHASQMAIFRRSEQDPAAVSLSKASSDIGAPGSYKLIYRQLYENHRQFLSPHDRILRILEDFINLADLRYNEFGPPKTIHGKKGKKPCIEVKDVTLKQIYCNLENPLPKGVQSFQEIAKVLKAHGYNVLVKCGPDKELGIRLPIDKLKMTVQPRFREPYSRTPEPEWSKS